MTPSSQSVLGTLLTTGKAPTQTSNAREIVSSSGSDSFRDTFAKASDRSPAKNSGRESRDKDTSSQPQTHAQAASRPNSGRADNSAQSASTAPSSDSSDAEHDHNASPEAAEVAPADGEFDASATEKELILEAPDNAAEQNAENPDGDVTVDSEMVAMTGDQASVTDEVILDGDKTADQSNSGEFFEKVEDLDFSLQTPSDSSAPAVETGDVDSEQKSSWALDAADPALESDMDVSEAEDSAMLQQSKIQPADTATDTVLDSHSERLAAFAGDHLASGKNHKTEVAWANKPVMEAGPTGQAQSPSVLFDGGSLKLNTGLDAAKATEASPILEQEFTEVLTKLEKPITATRFEAPAQSALHTSPLANSGRIALPVPARFGSDQWAGAVAEKSASLVFQNIQSAQLQLDPPELGPLTVKVHVQHDQATVSFVASNAAVKDALDASLPKLKELLQEQGLELADANVQDQSQQREQQREGRGDGKGTLMATTSASSSSELEAKLTLASGIDYFV